MKTKWMIIATTLLALPICGMAQDEAAEAVESAAATQDPTVTETEAVSEAPVAKAVNQDTVDVLPPAIVAFGDVDDALVERARSWVEQNLAIKIPSLPSQPGYQFTTFDEVVVAAENMMESKRIGIVVLWRPTSDISNHGAFYPDKRVAVANLNPMFTDSTDPEIIERRVERQAIRGVCMVLGLDPSPNPLSAMASYGSIEELDHIGRNLDMPWLQKVQKLAREKGLVIEPDSSYNVAE